MSFVIAWSYWKPGDFVMKRIALIPLLYFSGSYADPQVKANMTVTRSYCKGDTSSDSNCDGLELITITFKNGTVLGPFIATKATEEMISAPIWTAQETLECP
jgi:hypothetical protein